MIFPVLLAATLGNGGVLSMWDTEVEADSLEEAYGRAMEQQNWTPEKGGFLVSRVGDGIVIHDDNDPRKCWLAQ